MPLSKSSFKKYLQCTAYFWFDRNHPEVLTATTLNDFEQMLADQGKEVEKEFYATFPDVQRVNSLGMDAVIETQQLLSEGVTHIAQAGFMTDDYFAQSDLVIFKDDRHIDLYEIKSSSSMQNMSVEDGPPTASREEHITDIAFQYLVATKAGYTVDACWLVELNKDYRREAKLNRESLFVKHPVINEVLALSSILEQQMHEALTYSRDTETPTTCSCKYLPRKNQCPAFAYLHPEWTDYAVYDLARIGNSKNRLRKFIDEGIILIRDIPDAYDLLDSHRDQVHTWKKNETIFHADLIRKELNKLSYPLYFLDYETTSPAIPVYEDVKPYQHVPFQFSLHVLVSPGDEVKHNEYVHREQTNPMHALAQHLRSHMGNEGTIIVWNKSFEGKCNQNMATIVPNLGTFLLGLNTRMFDLMEIFSKRYFVHRDFKGSYSIKKVLPVLVPSHSYGGLAIADGGTATTQWSRMVFVATDDAEKEKIRQQLLEYCKLDTLAMVEIYKKVRKWIDEK